MTREWKRYLTAAVCAIVARQTWAQVPPVAILDIEVENTVIYIDDVAHPAKLCFENQ